MKISARYIVYSALAFVIVFLITFMTNPVISTSERSIASTSQVSPDLLKGHISHLAAEQFRNLQNPKSLERAADYIKSQWQSMGYEVKEQIFEVDGKQAKNLIAVYMSEGASDLDRIVIGAHYDVCDDLPGADDNASGVAGLLELSRLLKEQKPKVSKRIELVAWTLEEPPHFATEHMGSFHHAKSLSEGKIKVSLALSLEMIGYFSDEPNSQTFPIAALSLAYPTTGNFISVVGSTSSWLLTRKVKAAMKKSSKIPVYSINAPGFVQGIDYSDHRSYWHFGYPALMITDTSFYRNSNYHTDWDRPETLNYEKMAEVVKGVYGILESWDR